MGWTWCQCCASRIVGHFHSTRIHIFILFSSLKDGIAQWATQRPTDASEQPSSLIEQQRPPHCAMPVQTLQKPRDPPPLTGLWVNVSDESMQAAVFISCNEVQKWVGMQGENKIIAVHGKTLPLSHRIYLSTAAVNTLEELQVLVDEYKICAGVANSQYAEVWGTCSSGIVDKDTYRAKSCELAWKGTGYQCPTCHRLCCV